MVNVCPVKAPIVTPGAPSMTSPPVIILKAPLRSRSSPSWNLSPKLSLFPTRKATTSPPTLTVPPIVLVAPPITTRVKAIVSKFLKNFFLVLFIQFGVNILLTYPININLPLIF